MNISIKHHSAFSAGLLALLLATALPSYGDTSEADTLSIWSDDPFDLEAVVITSTRTPKAVKDAPVLTRVITRAEIAKVDATDIRDLLQQELPGLEFTYSMGHQVINMGGYDGNNILFLVDGERLAGESMDNVDFSRLDMSSVERIEIVRGAASTLYGSAAMGGVINIITKGASEVWHANVNSRYEGQTKQWRHGASGDFNLGKVNSLTTFQMTDAKALDLTGEESSINTAYASRSYNVRERLIYNPVKSLKLTGRVGYFFRERDNSTETHERYRDLSMGLKGNWAINNTSHLELSYSFDQYDKSDYNLSTRFDMRDYSNRQNIVRGLYSVELWHSVLTAGFDFMNDYLMSYQFAQDDNHHAQNSFDIFAQWDWDITRKWNLVAGLRYDYFSAARQSQPTWKLATMYKFDTHNSLRFSYAKGFRAPSLKEMYMDFFMGNIFMIYGNPDLKSETNHNLTLTYEHSGGIGNTLRYDVTATGYYNYFNDYITTATIVRDGAYGQMYTNVDHQRIVGADVSLQLCHSIGLGAQLNYALTKNIVGGDTPELTTARPHSLTWRIDYDHKFGKRYGLNVALSGRWLSPLDVTEYTSSSLEEAETTHYEGYQIWKFQLSQRFVKGINLNFAVDNIFDYRPKSYYANPPTTTGTTLTVGLSVDIDKFF